MSEEVDMLEMVQRATALARRLYLHVKHGGAITENDMERLVRGMEDAASAPDAAGRGEDCDNCGQWMPSGNPRVCGNCGMTRTLLPINEKFAIYFDEEGDVIIECRRPNQFLASHGSTANEAVLDMRETLQLAASMRRPTGDKSPTESSRRI